MKYLTLVFIFAIAGCTNIAVLHDDYCAKYSQQERQAFRTLTGGLYKIECDK